MDSSLESLREFFRSCSTERLAIQRGAYENDRNAALTRKGKGARYSAAFCATRIDLIDQVLREKGVTVDQARQILDEATRGNQ